MYWREDHDNISQYCAGDYALAVFRDFSIASDGILPWTS